MSARAAENTEQSPSSIIQEPSADQGHSLVYGGPISSFPCYLCPSKGSGLARHSDSTMECIANKDKGFG